MLKQFFLGAVAVICLAMAGCREVYYQPPPYAPPGGGSGYQGGADYQAALAEYNSAVQEYNSLRASNTFFTDIPAVSNTGLLLKLLSTAGTDAALKQAAERVVTAKQRLDAAQAGNNAQFGAGCVTHAENVKLDNGNIYTGPMKDRGDGKRYPHGYGTVISPSGDKFSGEFNDGSPVEGTLIEANGRVFKGRWRDSKLNGHVTMTDPSGLEIVGEYSDNHLVNGRATQPDGTVLEGKFDMEGHLLSGSAKMKNGAVQEGEFSTTGHLRSGSMKGKDGTTCEGEFDTQGRPTRGKSIERDGTREEGVWSWSGGQSGGTIIWPDGRSYKGDWRVVTGSTDIPEGNGEMAWPDGRRYVGEFRDGLPDGCGKMTFTDGKTQDGTWRKGDFADSGGLASSEPASRPQQAANGGCGTVTVTSETEGCDVCVDGSFTGNTPAKLRLKEGLHTIAVRKDGCKAFERQIKVDEGSELTLKAPKLESEHK